MNWKTFLFSAQGRIGRKTFWLSTLGFWVAYLILELPILAIQSGQESGEPVGIAGLVFTLFAIIGFLVLAYIGIIIQIKRWHDRDKSGWWILIGIIPLIGLIWGLVETGFLRGTEGPNRYGSDPLVGFSAQIGGVFDAPPSRL